MQLYVDRFNQRIGNGVRELIAAYPQLRVADKLEKITEFVSSTVGSWRSASASTRTLNLTLQLTNLYVGLTG